MIETKTNIKYDKRDQSKTAKMNVDIQILQILDSQIVIRLNEHLLGPEDPNEAGFYQVISSDKNAQLIDIADINTELANETAPFTFEKFMGAVETTLITRFDSIDYYGAKWEKTTKKVKKKL